MASVITRPPTARWPTRNLVAIGTLSLFSDIGHELTTAILPLFLAVGSFVTAAMGLRWTHVWVAAGFRYATILTFTGALALWLTPRPPNLAPAT